MKIPDAELKPNEFWIDLQLSTSSPDTIRIKRKVFFPNNSRDGYFSYKGKRVKVQHWDDPLWAIL